MKQTKICMNAMVGNEEATITRMLESVAPYIDYYVVQCNGNDGTRDIIDNFFKERGIDGFTYYIEWNYPGWNRDHTLQQALKAEHGCDWILRMDADEQLIVSDDFDWTILNDTSVQSWNVPADAVDTMYFRTWMWNAKLPWYFAHDKRHETIWLPEVGEGFQRVNLPTTFKQYITNDGDTWMAPMKFITDGLTLEIDKVPSSLVLEDPYHLFYIAKSYSDGYRDVNVLPFGKLHSDEYARRVIFYFEMYLNQVHNWLETGYPKYIDDMGYIAMILMGDANGWIGNINKQHECYQMAGVFNPLRNEHLASLCYYYEYHKMYDEMLDTAQDMNNPTRTNPFPDYSFLIQTNCYVDTGTLPTELLNRALSYVGQ